MMKYANLSLLILYPISWFAPLLHAGLLPIFGLSEISILSGLQSLWKTDIFLALLVTFFALFAPMIKTIGLALIHFDLLRIKTLPVINFIGKLAMSDIFLIAVYITLAKGIGFGRIETGWGLYLFSLCILSSILIGIWTQKPQE